MLNPSWGGHRLQKHDAKMNSKHQMHWTTKLLEFERRNCDVSFLLISSVFVPSRFVLQRQNKNGSDWREKITRKWINYFDTLNNLTECANFCSIFPPSTVELIGNMFPLVLWIDGSISLYATIPRISRDKIICFSATKQTILMVCFGAEKYYLMELLRTKK